MARDDYYSLLGIDKHAPDREIKRAYYNLARDLHPDKAKTPEEARINAEKLAVISKAYNTLKDPTKRAEYDGSASTRAGSTAVGSSAPANRTPVPGGSPSPNATPVPADPPTATPKVKPGTTATPPPTTAPKVSANDLQSQRILMAQKAFVKGMEFYKNAEYKKAVPFFDTAVSNDPESEPQYHMKLAQSLMKSKGSFNRAVQAAEKACEMDTYNMDFKLGLGEIYETVGIGSKAVGVYEEVLKWEPDNEKAKLRIQLLQSAEREKNPGFLAKVFPTLFKK